MCVAFFFFFFFFQEGSGACQHPDSDKSHSWLANSSPLAVTGVPS